MNASTVSFRAGCLFAVAGLAMGIGMAASGDHSLMPAHAHLNLLGWVALFLFGFYYRLHPAVGAKRLAMAQVGIWSLGTAILTVGVSGIHLGHAAFEPVAAVASLIVFASLLLFTVLVFRADALARTVTPTPAPAE